jgi:hypothetical protein
VKIFLGILSSSILSRWPSQLILCPFIHFTIFSMSHSHIMFMQGGDYYCQWHGIKGGLKVWQLQVFSKTAVLNC